MTTTVNLQKRYNEYRRLCKIANDAYISFISWFEDTHVSNNDRNGHGHCILCGIIKKCSYKDSYGKPYCSEECVGLGFMDDRCINTKYIRNDELELSESRSKQEKTIASITSFLDQNLFMENIKAIYLCCEVLKEHGTKGQLEIKKRWDKIRSVEAVLANACNW